MGGDPRQEPLLDVHDLTLRLEEAEEALRAIRQGEVDALVVQTATGEQIYTLRGADQSYRVLFQTLNEGALTLTADGAVLYVNACFAKFVGLPLERLLGVPLLQFVVPGDRPRLTALIEKGIQSSSKGEVRLIRADGTTLPVMASLNAVQVEGVGVTCTAVMTDLTELRQAQEALQRAHDQLEARVEARTAELTRANEALQAEIRERERLEAELRLKAEQLATSDRRKDEFLAMLAHELRNPLAPILNAVTVLRSLEPLLPAAQRLLAIIERQTRQLTRLVDDLLDVSRITRGKIQLRPTSLELREVIESAVEAVQPYIALSEQHLEVLLPPSPVRLHADPARLQQVVANLLGNAAKYTLEGGRIWLSAELEDAATVVIRVRDTGIGISPEVLPHVFDLFVQSDHSLDRAKGGLGIGLTMVLSLVELHGGSVAAASAGLGRGSEFTVRLPALPQETGESGRRGGTLAPAAVEGGCCRVLIVDDNVDAAETVAELLQLWGHEPHTAYDGRTALRAAVELRPHVILLDIGMPGMDGYEVAARLREEPSLGGVLLIALTGYGQQEDRCRTRRAGFDAHITKPVDPVELQRLLAAATSRQ